MIEKEEKQKGIWCKKPSAITVRPGFDVSIASEDFDVFSEQYRLWGEGKYDEARSLQYKTAAEVFLRN
jgi:hypothetical protein